MNILRTSKFQATSCILAGLHEYYRGNDLVNALKKDKHVVFHEGYSLFVTPVKGMIGLTVGNGFS